MFTDKIKVFRMILANPDFLLPSPEVTTVLALLHAVNLIIHGLILGLF